MEHSSRSYKSIKNIGVGFINKFVLLVFAFAMRTVFVRLLGAEYAGISGLFTNILSLLSIANLGFDGVLNYMMYQAVFSGDESKISGVVYYFKRFCLKVAFAILGMGILTSFFLPLIVKSNLDIFHVYLYYYLYLLDSVISYFVIYRTKVIIADQKQYIQDIVVTFATIVMYFFQTVYLIMFRDFTGYLVIQVGGTLLKNLLLDQLACRMYPYTKKRPAYIDFEGYDKLFHKSIEGTIFVGLGNLIVHYSDNIIISMLLGVAYVGYYSNYKLLTTYVATVIYILKTGIIASVGNFYAEKGGSESEYLFRRINRGYIVIAVACACAFLACTQSFIPIWIGREYLLDTKTVYAIIVLFFIDIIIEPASIMASVSGLFKEIRFNTLACAIVNIVLSISLGMRYQLLGIVLGTIIAKLTTQCWIVPYELYKHIFHCKAGKLLNDLLIGAFVTALSVVVTVFATNYISESIVGIIIRAVLSMSFSMALGALWIIISDKDILNTIRGGL